MTRILHFTRRFSPASETFIYDTLRLLQAEPGYDNALLTGLQENARQRPFAPLAALHRMPEHAELAERDWRKLRFWQGAMRQPRALWLSVYGHLLPHMAALSLSLRKKKLSRWIDAQQPELFHCHFGWGYQTFRPLIDRYYPHMPLLISLHGSDILLPRQAQMLAQVARRPHTRFTVPSHFLARKAQEAGIPAAQITVLANSFSPLFRQPRARHFDPKKDAFRIVCIARFVPWKGHRYLLEAFARFCAETNANSRLTLIGEGKTRGAMQQLAAELDVADKVRFMGGGLSRDAIAGILRDEDLYVQPSFEDTRTGQAESFGVALLEAIASGLPVIASQSGGMPEVLEAAAAQNHAYCLVPPQNADKLHEAMAQYVVACEQVFDNAAYAQTQCERFSNRRYMQCLTVCYDRLLKEAAQTMKD